MLSGRVSERCAAATARIQGLGRPQENLRRVNCSEAPESGQVRAVCASQRRCNVEELVRGLRRCSSGTWGMSEIEWTPPRNRGHAWLPWTVGLAAAILVLFLLSPLNASLTVENGSRQFAFHLLLVLLLPLVVGYLIALLPRPATVGLSAEAIVLEPVNWPVPVRRTWSEVRLIGGLLSFRTPSWVRPFSVYLDTHQRNRVRIYLNEAERRNRLNSPLRRNLGRV